MDKRIRLNLLYDYYKEFLTEKQQSYFEDYYFNNYSLGEIAEDHNISRNAIHNQLKMVEEKLEEMENILKLVDKKKEIINLLTDKVNKNIIDKIEDIL